MSGTRKTNSAAKPKRRTAPAALQKQLGYTFKDKSLLITALTHPTYVNNVDREAGNNNQRLEFLGDAVLGLLTAERVYLTVPDGNEGTLTVMRAQTVSGAALAVLGAEIDLGKYLYMDAPADDVRQRNAEHTLACAVEAVMGAVWLDAGLDGARTVFEKLFVPRMKDVKPPAFSGDPKGELQAFAHKNARLGEPVYTLVSTEGPVHAPIYRVKVRFGTLEAEGTGSRRRSAEAAAAAAWMQAYAE